MKASLFHNSAALVLPALALGSFLVGQPRSDARVNAPLYDLLITNARVLGRYVRVLKSLGCYKPNWYVRITALVYRARLLLSKRQLVYLTCTKRRGIVILPAAGFVSARMLPLQLS